MRFQNKMAVVLFSIGLTLAGLAQASEAAFYSCSPQNPYDQFSVIDAGNGNLKFSMVFSNAVEGMNGRLPKFLAGFGVNLSPINAASTLNLIVPQSACTIIDNTETYLLECQASGAPAEVKSGSSNLQLRLDTVKLSIEDVETITVGSVSQSKIIRLTAGLGTRSDSISIGNRRKVEGCRR